MVSAQRNRKVLQNNAWCQIVDLVFAMLAGATAEASQREVNIVDNPAPGHPTLSCTVHAGLFSVLFCTPTPVDVARTRCCTVDS